MTKEKETNNLQEAFGNFLGVVAEALKNEKPKFWYDKKTNRTGYQTRLGKKYFSTCREEDTYDKYVGCALCIARDVLGGNRNFREFVDKYWVGEEPGGYEPKKWVSPYLTGDRILFLMKNTKREYIGTILGVDEENKRYLIESFGKNIIIHFEEIIRKCRKANKCKEEHNDTTFTETITE